MSLACPDGHTSRFASIESESSAGHTAFSSMSLSLTVMPCFSRMTFATAAFAAEPSHGFTASVIEPLNVFAPPPPAVVSRRRRASCAAAARGQRQREDDGAEEEPPAAVHAVSI